MFPIVLNPKKVCIIGCGLSGIAMGRKLSLENISYTIFEKNSDVGGIWSKPYLNLHIQSSNQAMSYLDKPLSLYTNGSQASAEEVLNYLHDYIGEFHIRENIQFNTHVINAFMNKDLTWTITFKKEKILKEETFDFLVVCGGKFDKEYIPEIKNLNFKGEVCHINQIKTDEQFKNKKITVYGSGKSAFDMISNIIKSNKTDHPPTLLARSFHWPYPKESKKTKKLLFFSSIMKYKNKGKLDQLIHEYMPINKTFRKNLETEILTNYKLKDLGIVPSRSLNEDLILYRYIVTPYVFQEAVNKKIIIKQGEIQMIVDNNLVLNDSSEISTDLLILATGYATNLYQFFNEKLQQILHNDDGIYLYREIIHPEVYNCAFMGLPNIPCGISHSIQASWITYLIKGELNPLKIDEIETEIERIKNWKRNLISWNSRRAYAMGNHFEYFNELIRDMGYNEDFEYHDIFEDASNIFKRYSKYYKYSINQLKSQKY